LFSKYINIILKIKEDRAFGAPVVRRGGRLPRSEDRARRVSYQLCGARQCGQATVVDTGARKCKPQTHV